MKKIISIIGATLVVLLSAATLTLALIKTDYNHVHIGSNIESVDVYYGTKHGAFFADNEEFDKVLELFEKGTRETMLSSLFQGAYSKEAQAEILKNTIPAPTASGEKVVIKITYKDGELPTLKLNGEVYEDEFIVGEDKTVKYSAVWVEIENSTVLTKVTAYFRQESQTGNNANYRVKFISHHSDLYSYVKTLAEDVLVG